ncbi:MAG: hypothetical protein JXQ83_03140, partial [Candidatus Glassbacteria bacterium]|nr:hypothetical protein [Candidatus Glassbacteria bacterium]
PRSVSGVPLKVTAPGRSLIYARSFPYCCRTVQIYVFMNHAAGSTPPVQVHFPIDTGLMGIVKYSVPALRNQIIMN